MSLRCSEGHTMTHKYIIKYFFTRTFVCKHICLEFFSFDWVRMLCKYINISYRVLSKAYLRANIYFANIRQKKSIHEKHLL